MGCGEFIAVKLPVSDKYAIDGPVGTDDEGATIKNRYKKETRSLLGSVSASWVLVCGKGREQKGLVSVQMNAALG